MRSAVAWTRTAASCRAVDVSKAEQRQPGITLVMQGDLPDLAPRYAPSSDTPRDITNTTRINAVVANGRLYDRAAIEKLLANAQKFAASSDPTQ